MSVRLEVSSPGNYLVDFGNLQPKLICALSTKEIETFQVICGKQEVALGECCVVKRIMDDIVEVLISGSTSRVIKAAYAMEGGKLTIDGDAGPLTGAEMREGKLEIHGNAGHGLGLALHGGLIHTHGSAGDQCGSSLFGKKAGMNGGVIIIDGNAGAETGVRMRRGLIVIKGDSGKYTGVSLLAGTILCFGRVGVGGGLHMKRGTIAGYEFTQIMPGFRSSGEADLEWMRIYQSWLLRLGVAYPEEWLQRPPARYTGDHLILGKGELLNYDFAE